MKCNYKGNYWWKFGNNCFSREYCKDQKEIEAGGKTPRPLSL